MIQETLMVVRSIYWMTLRTVLLKNCKKFGKQCQIVFLPGFVDPEEQCKEVFNLTVDVYTKLAETQAYDTF